MSFAMTTLPAGLSARAAALSALSEVLRRRRPLDAVLEDAIAQQKLEPRDAGFARTIANETFRRFGQIDALIRAFVPKPPAPHRAGPAPEILMIGVCELLFLDVAPHATVDAANRLAAADNKAVHFKPLINAVLRRVAKEGRETLAQKDASRLNTPDWMWQRWADTYGGDAARAIANAHVAKPPTDFVFKSNNARLLPNAITLPGNMERVTETGRVDEMPGYNEGGWWVQDFAASLPARMLGDIRGKAVLDLCAAPGGKTMQLAAMGANVIAVEREPARLDRVRANLARTKLSAELVESDLRDYIPKELASFILLDAPCSATGTIRRHPELPWIKSASDIVLSAQAGGEYLDAATDMLAIGGTLVFAVCSLEPEEGPEQIAAFLERNDAFQRKPIVAEEIFGLSELLTTDGDLRTLPCHFADKGGMDGFYAARLVRLR
jgi:16S rRNA (cytosine967-C5)-methyltransferase